MKKLRQLHSCSTLDMATWPLNHVASPLIPAKRHSEAVMELWSSDPGELEHGQ